jgi:hypothetical protein
MVNNSHFLLTFETLCEQANMKLPTTRENREGSSIYNRKGVAMNEQSSKKPYTTPVVIELGTIADLTRTGKTNEGGDAKGGSVGHSQGV